MPSAIKHNQINFPTGSTPETPPAAHVALFIDSSGIVKQKKSSGVVSNISGVLDVKSEDVDWGDSLAIKTVDGYYSNQGTNNTRFDIIPDFSQRRWVYGWPNGNSTYGHFGSVMTEASAGASSVQEFKGIHFTRKFTSNLVLANFAGITTTAAEFRAQHEPLVSTVVHTGSLITSQRMWVGLFSASPLNVATLGTTQGFGFSYFSSDGNLSWVTSNGSTTTRTTMVAMLPNTSYLLDCWIIGTTAYFCINDGAISSTTTTLPATTTNLFYYNRVVNTTTISNTLNIGNTYIEAY
jgi:hypothetical protein